MTKTPLIGLTINELKEVVNSLKMPSFTAKQIAEWIYQKKVLTIDDMTNISKKNRLILSEKYCVGRCDFSHEAISIDGTKKYLFPTTNGYIESVFIPEDDRATLCVSCQVGCKMNCQFCMTGKQGFDGNLTAGEIINQVLSIPDSNKLTNIVFMGMGEPMDNISHLLNSIEILTSDYGFNWSPKRITVSSVGLIPGLKLFLEKTQCHLAISLHNPIAHERETMMPAEKAYPITKIIKFLKEYDFAHQRRLSFEYTLFKGENDTPRHVNELVKLLKGIPCRVNIIRYHEISNLNLQRAADQKAEWFRDYLNTNGIIATIRKSRGEDIDAACGMLSTKIKKENSLS